MRLRPWILEVQIQERAWTRYPVYRWRKRKYAIRYLARTANLIPVVMRLLLPNHEGYRFRIRNEISGESEELDIYHLLGS